MNMKDYILLKFNNLFNLPLKPFIHKYKIEYNEAIRNRQVF